MQVRNGLGHEGAAAFITAPKWFARVLMNALIQGTVLLHTLTQP